MAHSPYRRLGVALTTALVATTCLCADVFAQKLQITVERRFPSNWCPFDTPFIGTFQSDTGIIRLTFTTTNGHDDGQFTFFDSRLDNVMIVQAAEFNANSQPNEDFCYVGNIVPVYTGNAAQGAPVVPLFEPFSPPGSECPWDELNGSAITGDYIALGNAGLGEATVSTSVVVSGLTPGVDYTIHGDWHADGFLDTPLCVPGSVCLEVRVDDVTQGCGPLPTEESTWGRIKALYR